MSRDDRLLLVDIRDACRLIQAWISELKREQFAKNEVHYHACLQQLTVIGEAVKKLSPELKAAAPDVAWTTIAGLRDVIAHGYFALDDATVWQTCIDRVPELEPVAVSLLESLGQMDGA